MLGREGEENGLAASGGRGTPRPGGSRNGGLRRRPPVANGRRGDYSSGV